MAYKIRDGEQKGRKDGSGWGGMFLFGRGVVGRCVRGYWLRESNRMASSRLTGHFLWRSTSLNKHLTCVWQNRLSCSHTQSSIQPFTNDLLFTFRNSWLVGDSVLTNQESRNSWLVGDSALTNEESCCFCCNHLYIILVILILWYSR